MRNHPLVGGIFLLAGAALFTAGATARDAPAALDRLPLPPEVVVPFVLWQLAVWAVLFGFFFLRPRHGRRRGGPRHVRLMARV